MERAALAVQGFMKPGGQLCRKLAGPFLHPRWWRRVWWGIQSEKTVTNDWSVEKGLGRRGEERKEKIIG